MSQQTLVDAGENLNGDEMCHIKGCPNTDTPYVINKVTLLCEEHAPDN